MSLHYKTRGFVFKKEDRQEADRIFSVFTQDFGRMQILGKAIRKISSKLKSGIDLFSFSEIEFVEGHQLTLTDARVLQRPLSLEPEVFDLGLRVTSLMDDFIKGQEADTKIWNFTKDFFEKLSSLELSTQNSKLTYYYFFWNFIAALGHAPELSCCLQCRSSLNPSQLFFSYSEGGIICKSCATTSEDKMPLGINIVKLLRIMLQANWQMFLKIKMLPMDWKELEKISENYYRYLASSHV